MKSKEKIEFEIERQIKALLSKGVKPEFILIGSLSYYSLVNNYPQKLVKVSNEGMVLKEFNGLEVILNPNWSKHGLIVAENDFVKVVGS